MKINSEHVCEDSLYWLAFLEWNHAMGCDPRVVFFKKKKKTRVTGFCCQIFVHCVNVYCCDWCSKKAEWPIGRKDRWDFLKSEEGGRGRI